MGRVIDLTGGGADAAILTSTSSDGLFGGTYLSEEPLEAYLGDVEEPKYVLRNKKSGLRVRDGDEERVVRPDEGYQALALVTDLRLLVVVGREGSDERTSLLLTDIVEVRAESQGFRTDALVVDTLDGDAWEFPCQGDLTGVASDIDGLAQTWANASRLISDVESQLEEADRHLAANDHAKARDAIGDADDTIATAKGRIADVGGGAAERVAKRASGVADRLVETRRRIRATRGAVRHAEAQEAWNDREYETAARAYEDAIDAYRAALALESPTPGTEVLNRRLAGAAGERELLRVAPLVDADAARRRASAIDDPEAAAVEWETALEGYRDMLGLDWGRGTRRFLVDRDRIRDHAEAVADDAIADHTDAGRQWLRAGDNLAARGETDQAERVYERARTQFERAHRLARELRPDRADDIEADLGAVTDRLAGDVPDSPPGTEPFPGDAAGDVLESVPDRGSTPTPAIRQVVATDASNAKLRERLRGLSADGFTQLVAALWEDRGWSTAVFTSDEGTLYDIVAIRDGGDRLLLWAVHHPDGGVLGPSVLERSATVRDTTGGGAEATLVTTGSLTTAARQRAAELDVRVVDCGTLVELVASRGLGGLLEDVAARPRSG